MRLIISLPYVYIPICISYNLKTRPTGIINCVRMIDFASYIIINQL